MKIHIWTNGDRSVGIAGCNATVEIEGWDYIETVKSPQWQKIDIHYALQTAFAQIFDEDTRNVHVAFDEEDG